MSGKLKDAAEGAQKTVLQFSKTTTMEVVSDQILEDNAGSSTEFKTALKKALVEINPPATVMELDNVRKATVNKRRVAEGIAAYVNQNHIDAAWNALSEVVKEKAITAHALEQEKRRAECAGVFKEIIKHRLNIDIIDEVKRGQEYNTALLEGNLVWLIKRIREVKSMGNNNDKAKTLEKLQAIKQGNNGCSAHLLAFSHGIDEMVHAGGWTKAELDNVGSLQAELVKSALLDSLTLKTGQTIMAAAISDIRSDTTLSYAQMSKKLVDAEASQLVIDEKTGAATKKKALALKKEENKDEKKGDDKDNQQSTWKRGSRGGRGNGRGGGRGDGSGRGGRGEGNNNGRSSGRGGGDRGNGGRGRGDRGYDDRGDRNRGDNRDGRGDDSRSNDREHNDNGGRGRGGRIGGRGFHNTGGRGGRQDRDDNYDSSSWRGGGYQQRKHARFEESHPSERRLIIVCGTCDQKPHNCVCDDDEDRSARVKGSRKVGVSKMHHGGLDGYGEDEYEFSEEPYRDPTRRGVRRATSRVHSFDADSMVQFDTAADLLVIQKGSNYLEVEPAGRPLSITGITGQTVTPKKSGKIGMIEAVQDERFSAAVAPGMALMKANPGCGVLMTSEGLQIIDGFGMGKIKKVVDEENVMANGVAREDGWYLNQKDVKTLALGTPSKVMRTRQAVWALSEDRVIPSPTAESHHVRVISRRRRTDNLQPDRPPALQMTPAAMKLATEVQQIRSALHPSDAQLHHLLDNNLIDTQASAQDGLNALQLFGPDYPRLKAVVKNPSQYKTSQNHPALEVGEVVSGDLHVVAKTNLLSMVDHYSGFQHIESLGHSKATKSVEEGIKTVIKDYNQNTHRMQEVRFDSEANLVALSAPQGLGIKVTHAPPGAHATFAESHYGRLQEKYLTMVNSFPYSFDAVKHPQLVTQLLKTAKDILNVLPNSRTGPMLTPFQLFTGKRHKLKPENMVPIGTIALFKDINASGLDQNKTRAGILVGYNFTCPGNFYVYDPTTGRKPELEFLGSTKHILDHDAAMRLVSQWEGFKPQATLNHPLQPVVPAVMSDDVVHPGSALPSTQALVRDEVRDQVQEGAQIQVEEAVQAQAVAEGAAQEGVVQIAVDAVDGQAVPQSPIGYSVLPHEPPPVRGDKVVASQAAPQQEGESVGPAPQDESAVDLRSAFFTLHGQDSAVCAAEFNHFVGLLESYRAVNVTKNKNANSGSQLYKRYEKENPEALEAALRIEIEGLSKRMLGHAVPSHSLSVKEMHNVVHTMVLLKEKFLPSGEFEKLKARLVALGNRMNEGTYGDTYSPTLGHASLMVLLCIGAVDDAEMEVTDVPCAFPNTPRDPKDGRVTVRITGKAAEIWCDIHPEDWVLLNRQGHLLVDLDQYLYGMKDAPAAFHRYLKKVLEDAGFEAIISDVCLIKKFTKTGYFIAGGHVDDLLSVHKGDPQLEKDFVKALAVAFGDGVPLESKKIEKSGNYVGMFIERDRKNHMIYLSQPQSIATIRDNYPNVNWNQRAPTPSTSDMYSYDRNAGAEVNGEKVNASEYLGKVMSGMYVATKTRPDILKDLTFLSGIKEPTERSDAMVDRVLVYLYNTRHKRLRLRPVDFKLGAFGDAGFATHLDGYSQSGMVFTFGNTPFFFKCGKQRRITLSSTDGEYETLTEICKYLEWLKGLLEELEIYHRDPIKVYQDNKSTITLATGPGVFKRSKQNLIRYQYVKDLVKDGTIDIVWVPTENMIADILTKVLAGAHFRSQVEGLGVV